MRSSAAMLSALALLTGCASGVKYAELKSKIPPVPADQGRIFVLRPSSMGFGVKPDIRLNDEVIGRSVARGFFYVDKAPGSYQCMARTEVTRSVSFQLEAGETKYIRSWLSIGLLVGRMNFELMDPAAAEQQLQDLAFTGTLEDGTSPVGTPPPQPANAKSAGDSTGPASGAGGWWAPGSSQRTE